MHSRNYVPRIYFSKETIWDENNPWLCLKDQILESWHSIRPDVLLLGALDWWVLDAGQRERSSVPIINLILGVRHAQPNDPRYSFLKHKAIRICCSEVVGTALMETRQVNGPLFVIPGGVDIWKLPKPTESSEKDYDLLIAALKQPELGHQLKQHLEGSRQRIQLLTTNLLRSNYLNWVNRAKVTIFLPCSGEGLYRPALEGMALGTLVVCPKVMGTEYCLPDYNCFQPKYAIASILEAAETALQNSQFQKYQMLDNARLTVAKYDLMKERKAFLDILENVDQLW